MNQEEQNQVFLDDKRKRWDDFICKLWCALREVSEYVDPMSDEDLALWEKVTHHSAVQSKLESKP